MLVFISLAAFVAVALPQRSVAAGDPIELFAILSMTGSGAFLGKGEQEGLLRAAEHLNQSGGITGRPVTFTIQDDGSNPQTALTLGTALIARKVPVFIGPTLAASCNALAPLLKSGPVMYCLSASFPPERGSYFFTYQSPATDSVAIDFRYFRERGLKRIAMLASTDSTGQTGEAGIDAQMARPENGGLTIADREHYALNDLSVAAQIARIKSSGAQVLVAFGTGTPIGTVFRGIQDAGLEIPVVVSAGNFIYPEMKQFGAILPKELLSAAPPSITLDTLPKGPTKNAVREYIEAFKAAGIRADISEANTWDPAQIIFLALKKFGPNASATQIKDFISTLHGYAGANGIYDFRTGDQRGVSAFDNIIIARWDAGKDTWVAVSKFGGAIR